MKLELRKSDWHDWYIIEIADVEPKEWLQEEDDGFSYHTNTRISDAEVEGTRAEMLAIANAIDTNTFVKFKRCAVDARTNVVQLWSPRNSRNPGECSIEVAKELAKHIRTMLCVETKD